MSAVVVFGGGALGGRLGHLGRVLINEVSVLTEEAPEKPLVWILFLSLCCVLLWVSWLQLSLQVLPRKEWD